MKTLTNTQINKTLKLIEKNGIRSINFYKEHLTIVFDFIENTQTTYVNGITQNDTENLNNNEMLLLIKKMINKKEYTYVIKSMFNTTKKQFIETLRTKEEEIKEEIKEEEEIEDEKDENGNIIVIKNDDVYDYYYNSTIRDFNDSYFHNQILKVDNLDKKDEENSDFLFQGLHLNFDNTCNILTLQTSKNYKEKLIDNKIEEINFDTNNHKNFSITTEQLKEIFFEEFDRRYDLDSEDFEEIYEYSLSKIKAVLDFLEEEIEERVEKRNEEEVNSKN